MFPYKTRQAASGAVTDCIAFGLPFIVSDRFKSNRQFEGLIFELDAKALADRILDKLKSQSVIRSEILRWQDEFSWEKSARSQYALYSGILSQ
ncbi:MAG: hypothetical protein TR69_WS6001001041 [candidate division WS6 bacterium OLB20]|uniref:Uncharacterized protein n=1 Tax=candidate division WS6 bacterium OLB20 TaxID=1617426 RepID=A0A136LZE8_9BACT|nr:MAG: hypothetical protein TR69_WS6001001041 [candidate division WS6 bacterium OLB20]